MTKPGAISRHWIASMLLPGADLAVVPGIVSAAILRAQPQNYKLFRPLKCLFNPVAERRVIPCGKRNFG